MWRAALRASVAVLLTSQASAQSIIAAAYADATTRYDHGILGDAVEWGALVLGFDDRRSLTLRLPESRVFEDSVPRLPDLNGDGAPEVIVIETDLTLGARLAVYGPGGLLAATDFIGQTHRWLAPIGAADLDGDGQVEIAYIDRPHLARTLRIVRMEGDRLVEIASAPGLTNHRIGEDTIGGGLRNCADGPEIVTANADWTRIIASRLEAGSITSRDIGPFGGSFDAALICG